MIPKKANNMIRAIRAAVPEKGDFKSHYYDRTGYSFQKTAAIQKKKATDTKQRSAKKRGNEKRASTNTTYTTGYRKQKQATKHGYGSKNRATNKKGLLKATTNYHIHSIHVALIPQVLQQRAESTHLGLTKSGLNFAKTRNISSAVLAALSLPSSSADTLASRPSTLSFIK